MQVCSLLCVALTAGYFRLLPIIACKVGLLPPIAE